MQSLHLLYHELRPLPSDYSYVLEYAEFERHCALFARLHREPAHSLWPALTFDDGHRSNYEFALPALQQHGLHAHFFITAGWTGRRSEYMGWDELRALHAAGQQIGAHGLTHTLLTHCTPAQLDRELTGARQRLEDGLGAPVTAMSLPGGRSNRRVLEACWQAGYQEVFTSVPRAEPRNRTPPTTTGRLNVRNRTTVAWLEQVLQPETGLLAKLERRDRMKRAAKTVLGDTLYARLWSILNREEPQPETHGIPAK